ncbi:MAG: hydrogenase 3 maturation endopeptidase HyCI [Acetobacteraceae bacterium]|nr:hydrogenase 3 maturation endopeptidase HyCI [Acetobacteraceae bacterium]
MLFAAEEPLTTARLADLCGVERGAVEAALLELEAALAGAARVAVVGVGQELHRDDGAGMRAARLLAGRPFSARGGGTAAPGPAAAVFLGGVAPENQTGALRRFNPSHVVLIDAADLGRAPGTVELIPSARIGGVTFSTHTLPLRFLARFLEESLGCRVVVVGIQPRNLGFGKGLSPEVEAACRRLAKALEGLAPGAAGS